MSEVHVARVLCCKKSYQTLETVQGKVLWDELYTVIRGIVIAWRVISNLPLKKEGCIKKAAARIPSKCSILVAWIIE